MALKHPQRLTRVFAYGANVNMRYITPPAFSPIFPLIGPRLEADYASLSNPQPDFERLTKAVRAMQASLPNFSDEQLASIKGPQIAIVGSDRDEFISKRHLEYSAAAIPGARLIMLRDVSHFAPWQDAPAFNAALIGFLDH